MSFIINKIIKFISDNPLEEITAMSVIYKIMEDIPEIQEESLFEIINDAIQNVESKFNKKSDRYKKLQDIPKQVSCY